jgi:xanthosine utilization system XapX-like protein
MSSKIGASVVAGLVAGIVFGMMMQMMMVPTPDGGQMAMIAMVGQIVGSPTVGAGWLYHLFNSGIIGAIFGLLFSNRVRGYASGLGWGALYGIGWWILGGLILMPVMLGMAPFAPLMMPAMRVVAMGSVVGHLIYGLILGGVFAWLFGHAGARQLGAA